MQIKAAPAAPLARRQRRALPSSEPARRTPGPVREAAEHRRRILEALVPRRMMSSGSRRPETPDELRERAVKMLFEVREAERVRGTGSWPGSHVSWVFTRRHCGPGQSRRRSTAECGPGTTTDDKQRIAELEREVRELRRG